MKVKIVNNLKSNGIVEIIDDETFERNLNEEIAKIEGVKEIKVTSAYDERRYKVVVTVLIIY
jgi:hypothetical protein